MEAQEGKLPALTLFGPYRFGTFPRTTSIVCSHSIPMFDFPTTTHLYYAISRSLRRGSNDDGWPKRPSLPIEIILQIFDWAGFITRPAIVDLIATYNVPCYVYSFGSRATQTFMHTKPMNKFYLTRLRRLQVETNSHDQGWADFPECGSFSWFEVVILSPNKIQDGKQEFGPAPKPHPSDSSRALVWRSHDNRVAEYLSSRRFGIVFTETHEIWEHLAEGDVIGVRACAEQRAWSNTVDAATMRLWERFDPTILG